MSSIKTVTVEVDVTVDLSDIDTDDLIGELESRGHSGLLNDADEQITEMFYAFKLGRDDRAIEIAKDIAQSVTGMILC